MAPLDAQGIWHYTGAELAAPAPDTWNRLAGSTSTQVGTLRTHTVQVYASAAARTAEFPAPHEGAVTWLSDVDRLEVYNGTAWRALNIDASGTYTPTATNVVLGNGTITGRWWTSALLLNAEVVLTWGSTTTSTAPVFLGMPTPLLPASPGAASPVGLWSAYDVSAASSRAGFLIRSGGTATVRNADGTAGVGGTVPWTWAAGDYLMGEFAYPLSAVPAVLAALAQLAAGEHVGGLIPGVLP